MSVRAVRVLVAMAVLVSAYVHLKLWLDGVRHEHVVGPAFLLNVLAGVVIAGLLLARRDVTGPLLALGFGLSTLGGFVIAATVGLFGVHEHWQGPYVWTATVAELVAIAGGVVLVGPMLLAVRRRPA